MRLDLDRSYSSLVNQRMAQAFAVAPKSYMDTGASQRTLQPPLGKGERFDKCLAVFSSDAIQPANAAEAVQTLNTLIVLGERAYWGDNLPRPGRMYPLTTLGTHRVAGHPEVSVLVSAKQAMLVGGNGACQVWERDDAHNGDSLELTRLLLDKPGANHKRLDMNA